MGNDFAGLLSKKVPLNTFPLNLSIYQLGKVKESLYFILVIVFGSLHYHNDDCW